MARFRDSDRDAHGALVGFLAQRLPEVAADPFLLGQLAEVSGCDRGLLERALGTPGSDPMVRVIGLGFGDLARFDPVHPDRIDLSEVASRNFTANPDNQAMRRFVEAKALHELAHWADYQVHQPFESADAGERFERAAYFGPVEPPEGFDWERPDPASPARASEPRHRPRLADLDAAFGARVAAVLDRCEARGIQMRPYSTVRDPWVQARLWRQGRSAETILTEIARLQRDGAPFLARIVDEVGPQHDQKEVTRAIPGLSWHQWGEAVDCFWLVDGGAEWSPRRKIDGANGYAVYAEAAAAEGLTAGGHWPRFKDWPHVQARVAGSPLGAGLTLPEIDRAMRERFG